jgi:hypothetical protein
MSTDIQVPTAERVKTAIEKFDRDNELVELTLRELFRQYPSNSDARHVLLKVVAVNSLYHTCIFALDTVARHIHENYKAIDAAIAAGSPEVVDLIAHVKVNGKIHNFFSFATKYCSWHKPSAYPVYDSHVDHYLWSLQQQSRFSSFLHPDLWSYPRFVNIIKDFQTAYGLSAFSFKEIDQFLYQEGTPKVSDLPTALANGPGAFDFYPAEEIPS